MFEVLDVAELRRNRAEREFHRKERQIEWRVSLRTHMLFHDLLAELLDLDLEPVDEDTESRRGAIQEQIRSLPGFPQRYHPDLDVIVPVVTSAMR